MNPNPLEKFIEAKVVAYAKSKGCLVYKFTSPSCRSVPDRMFITPTGLVFFMELKRLGEKPTAAQAVEIAKIRKQGVVVFVTDNVEDGKKAIDIMLI
jgi:hypothetical protein